MAGPTVAVHIDDRVRLLSVLLALTTWPEQEQDQRPHGVHAHARTVRAALQDAENHPAVINMQELLESGRGLPAIFSYAGALTPDLEATGAPDWAPPDWARQIRDFKSVYGVAGLWEDDGQAWADAEAAAVRALSKTDPAPLLAEVFGVTESTFIFYPNLCYPSAEAVGFRMGGELACLCPPHVAWGESPPWPYDDDPPATHREAMGAYARVLLRELLDAHPEAAEAARHSKAPLPNTFLARYPDWFDQLAVLLVGGQIGRAH